jgi:type II secretory pathway pseudopilin PulG
MNRRNSGMTAIELVVAVGIIAAIALALIPVLGNARSIANKQSTKNEMTLIYIALQNYASDNSGYTPVNSAVNGGDFTPQTLGKSPSGKDVWGIPPIHGGSYHPQYHNGTPPTNYPLGYGALVSDGYMERNLLWTPTQRAENDETYARSMYFGADYQEPWSDLDNGNSGPWSPWYGGGNYWLSGGYSFRSGDWSTFVYDNKIPTIGTGGPYNDGAIRDTDVSSTRPTTAGYTTKVVLVENSGISYFPNFGGNILNGDGNVTFWNSAEHAAGIYTKNYISTYPMNPAAGNKFHAGFRSLLMDAADKFKEE